MNEQQPRGSLNLGELSPDDLHLAIDAARASYKIERWWKFGQPAIDRIEATLNITDVKTAGQILGGLAGLQGGARQIGLEVFPYGIRIFDGMRVRVRIDQASH
jgi:hypothetical protein